MVQIIQFPENLREHREIHRQIKDAFRFNFERVEAPFNTKENPYHEQCQYNNGCRFNRAG